MTTQSEPETGWHPLGPEKVPEKKAWVRPARNEIEQRLMAFRPDMSFCENNKDLSPQDVLELLSEDRWSAEYAIKKRRGVITYEQKLNHCRAILTPLPTQELLTMFVLRRFQYDYDYYRHDGEDNGANMSSAIKDVLREILNTREHVPSSHGSTKARRQAAKRQKNPIKQRTVKTRCGRKT